MDVQPVRERQRGAGAHVGAEMLAIQIALPFVRRQHHDHVGPLGGLGRTHDPQPGRLRLGDARRTRTQADHEVCGAAILQVQRMGMALAAVADDRDLLGLDQVNVGVAVVINAHRVLEGCQSLFAIEIRRATAGGAIGGDLPRARDFAPRAEPPSGIRSDRRRPSFSVLPVISKTKLPVVASTTRARKASARRSASARRCRCEHLDQRHLAGDVRALAGEVGDAVDRHQAVELRLDLLDHHLGARRHDVDAAAAALVVDRRHGQAVDVVAAAGEQPDDAGEHAGLVLDQDGDGCGTIGADRWRGHGGDPSDQDHPLVGDLGRTAGHARRRGSSRCARRRSGSSGTRSPSGRRQMSAITAVGVPACRG